MRTQDLDGVAEPPAGVEDSPKAGNGVGADSSLLLDDGDDDEGDEKSIASADFVTASRTHWFVWQATLLTGWLFLPLVPSDPWCPQTTTSPPQ